ncbi:MAG: metallophosphoesterase [Methanosphaera sp.]|nr:metallophosphoesterase [Methanosphaera sp.]
MAKKLLGLIGIILCIFLAIMVIEPSQLEVNEITVQSDQIPVEFNGTRIVLIADFHYGEFVDEERVEEVVNKTNEQNPDIIVLAGDYVTDNEDDVDTVISQLDNLQATYGVYAVLGNNDPKDKTEEAINNSQNIISIRNNGTWIQKDGAQIRLGGVGDMSTDYQYPRETTAVAADDDFVILVYHNPNYFDTLNHSRVDLSLSGHTHGGQVNLFGFTPWIEASEDGNKYISGLYTEGDGQLVVTNGVGVTKLPFRFMATPQITMITLESTA